MTKVSLYIDEEVWSKFRERVFSKYGNLRKLSSEVETVLRSTLVQDRVSSAFQKLGFQTEGTVSSRQVKENRPMLRGPPSEEIVREMRGKRIAEAVS